MAINQIFRGFCINRFGQGPLHYVSSRSHFGFKFSEIFVFEKRLLAITDTGSRSVRDLGQSDLCKNLGKFGSLPCPFKGTQAWDNFEFFFTLSNLYMPFVNFRKKVHFFSFDFRQNFDVRTFPRWLSIRGTKFFLEISKKIFSSKSSLWSYEMGSLMVFQNFGFS